MAQRKLSPVFKTFTGIFCAVGAVSYGIVYAIESGMFIDENAPLPPDVLEATAKMDSDIWSEHAAIHEIPSVKRPGEVCVFVENFDALDMDCFRAAAAPSPSPSTSPTTEPPIMQPAYELESDMWNEDAKYYEYTPHSNPDILCRIVENVEFIRVRCDAPLP